MIIVLPTQAPLDIPRDARLEPLPTSDAGYVLTAATAREAVTAVQHILAGWLPPGQPQPTRAVRPQSSTPGQAPESLTTPELTARERDVLRLVAAGQTNREIACALQLSMGTVKGHVQHLLAKLGVADRTQAAVRSLQLGLLPSSQA